MKLCHLDLGRHLVAALLGSLTLLAACGGDHDRDGLAARRAALLASALDAKLHSLQSEHPELPGIVATVVDRDSGATWAGSTGVTDRASARPMPPNASFRTASVTKLFTAAATLRLVEQGRVALADPLVRHLSAGSLEILRSGGYDPSRMTVDHLLMHRSGLPDHALSLPYVEAVLADPMHRWTRTEQLRLAMQLGAPLFAPGSDYRYSDTGYLLLGELVERHTGQQLGAAFRALLRLDALGLAATWQESVDPPPAGAGPRAHQTWLDGIDDVMVDASTDLWGAGGLVSSADDLARFVRALLDGRVLGNAALHTMLADATVLPGTDGRMAYARGVLRVRSAAGTCFGHDGFSGAFVLHCPDRGITVAGSIQASTLVGAPEALDVALELVRVASRAE